MPYPEKKRQRLKGHLCNEDVAAVADNNDFQASIESLSEDVIANIFGFLLPQEIMRARLNKKMREAAKITIVPPTYELVVWKFGKSSNAMRVMATALPNLQKITLSYLGDENKYVDGEDPDEDEAARTDCYTTHDIEVISNFTKLRELKIDYGRLLNGRYPCLFNFPHLQILSIGGSSNYLKFDLEVLAGLPVLKEFACVFSIHLTGNLNSLRALKELEKVKLHICRNVEGNINSLRVLKNTLEKVKIDFCPLVKGNFMDLADFQHLKELDLSGTAVAGDIRDIGENKFPSLEELTLPKGVYGGAEHEFQRISDAVDVVRVPYLFQKQRPEIVLKDWYALLSRDSPDSYEVEEYDIDFTPDIIRLVRAGTRVGYRWENELGHPCEVNWLDPEPDTDSAGYGKYMEELQEIEEKVDFFKGFYQPPPQEEFERISERYKEYVQEKYGIMY